MHDVLYRRVHPHHHFTIATQKRAVDQTTIVDGVQLLDEQVGIGAQSALRCDVDAQRFCIVYELESKRNDARGGMLRIQQSLTLHDQSGRILLGAVPLPEFRFASQPSPYRLIPRRAQKYVMSPNAVFHAR